MRLLVINNLASGYGDGIIFDFLRMVSKDGTEVCLRNTDGTTSIASLLDDADSFDAVIASGGDGTVVAVAFALANTGIPILPFPAGTANLLANNLASPMEPHALVKVLDEGRTLDFDLGVMEAGGEEHGFGVMAGAGYDATIMHDAAPVKKFLGQIAYFQAAMANALPRKSHLKVVVDGQAIETDGLGVLLVNFSKIQFDIAVTHDNTPRDGAFDIVILKAQNAFELIPVLIAGLRDRDGEFPDRTDSIEVHRGREVYVEADPPMQIQHDGEVPGPTTPFHARVLDKAARFIISEQGYADYTS